MSSGCKYLKTKQNSFIFLVKRQKLWLFPFGNHTLIRLYVTPLFKFHNFTIMISQTTAALSFIPFPSKNSIREIYKSIDEIYKCPF
jgi:hypothetical protein